MVFYTLATFIWFYEPFRTATHITKCMWVGSLICGELLYHAYKLSL